MFIVDSPGRLVGNIHCRTWYRCVQVDPDIFPPAPIPRLRCSRCGLLLRIGGTAITATAHACRAKAVRSRSGRPSPHFAVAKPRVMKFTG